MLKILKITINGTNARYFFPRFRACYVEQGIELSKSIRPNNPVKAMQGDIFNIPYDHKKFSVAHSSGVYEHFDDDQIIQQR